MTTPSTPEQALHIAPSARGQVRPILLILAFLFIYVIVWLLHVVPAALALAGVVVFGLVGALGVVTAWRSRRWGPVLRLDASGVTVKDQPVVAWSDLREVAITGMQPQWFFGTGYPRYQVVAFIPRPGVVLPSLPLPGSRVFKGRLLKGRHRLYGTLLVLMPHAMTATADEIGEAVARWGNLPVTQQRPARRA